MAEDEKDAERALLARKVAEALARVPNLSKFSRDWGIDRRSLTRYAAGEIEPSATTLLRIARGLGVSLDELAGSIDPQTATIRDARHIEALEAGQMQMSQAMHILASPNFALIPRLNVRVAAGIGKINYHERTDIDQVPVSQALLKRLGVQEKNAHIVQVEGDSMGANIIDQDDVLIDVGDTQPKPSGVYAVQYGEEAMLKRVMVIPLLDIVSLVSDNEEYPDIAVKRGELDRFRVIGRAKLIMRVL